MRGLDLRVNCGTALKVLLYMDLWLISLRFLARSNAHVSGEIVAENCYKLLEITIFC